MPRCCATSHWRRRHDELIAGQQRTEDSGNDDKEIQRTADPGVTNRLHRRESNEVRRSTVAGASSRSQSTRCDNQLSCDDPELMWRRFACACRPSQLVAALAPASGRRAAAPARKGRPAAVRQTPHRWTAGRFLMSRRTVNCRITPAGSPGSVRCRRTPYSQVTVRATLLIVMLAA